MVNPLVWVAPVMAIMSSPAMAQTTLAAGESLPLVPDPVAELRLDAPPRSYVAGRITGASGTRADLLAPDGSHIRNLADAAFGEVTFRFVAGPDAPLIRLSGGGAVTVTLDQVVTPRTQNAQTSRPTAQYLSPRIAGLATRLEQGGDSAAFWRDIAKAGTPLVEDGGNGTAIVTFLWQGAARNVRLIGAPSNDHEWLDRLGQSDVWFKTFRIPDDTRLSYRLAPDVPDIPGNARDKRIALLAVAQADPLNRHPWPVDAPDRFNQSSTITLPKAPPQPGTPPDAGADPVIRQIRFDSPLLGNSREVTLAHPRGFDPDAPDLVTLFVFDGERALRDLDLPRVLDSLTRQGRLPPVLAVLIPSIDAQTRARELPGNDIFADALVTELLPLVRRETGITPDPARMAVTGASFGGLASATVAFAHPEVFGNAIVLSGSFWWAPPEQAGDVGIPHVAARYAAVPKRPVRFFISAGRFETGRDGSAGIIETSRALRDVLRLRGYQVTWREYAAGHDHFAWRGAVADGLIALFGP